MTPFPIAVVARGAGSPPEDDRLDYLPLPQEMSTYAAPRLGEGHDRDAQAEALATLEVLLERMRQWRYGAPGYPEIDLRPLAPAARRLVNEALGEGEVSAIIGGAEPLQVQETVFAGVWRLLSVGADSAMRRDAVVACGYPAELVSAARGGADSALRVAAAGEGVMNAPAILAEVLDRAAGFSDAAPAHVVNLSLLPLSPADHPCLRDALGAGAVSVLSRGYGNCRVASTRLANTWWVQYFNSVDSMILNTIEVTALPEVVPAAAEDLADSVERLAEWIASLREQAWPA